MPKNSEIIISDTSCLILLLKINELELLNKFKRDVFITPEINEEFGQNLPDWIKIKEPEDKHYQRILSMNLDIGEASAIALSLEFDNSILIIDDLKGRKIAERLNLRFSGTFGLILRAKLEKLIPAVKPILDKIKKTNFRFNEEVFDIILKEAGE